MVTFNANGLNIATKRKAIFDRFVVEKHDVILIQETHCSPSSEYIWTSQWKGSSFWSNGTAGSRGVAILIKHGLDVNVLSCIKDNEGRYLILKCCIDNVIFTICNVYAPVSVSVAEQCQFLQKLENELDNIEVSNLLVAGDFNCVMNEQQDRARNGVLSKTTVSNYVHNLKEFADGIC